MGFFKDLLVRRPVPEKPVAEAAPVAVENRFHVVSHVGSVIRLRREYEERYVILHRHVFPEVAERIRKSNIRNYSIFLRDGVLFSHFEYIGEDFKSDMAAMGDPVTREWWKLTEPMQAPLRTREKGEWWASATFLGHFGGDVDLPVGGKRWAVRRPIGRVNPRRLRLFVEQVRAEAMLILRSRGLQNVSLYCRDGWLYAYGEYGGSQWEHDLAAFLQESGVAEIEKGFSGMLGGTSSRSGRKAWEPMREVFHQM